MYIYTLYSIVYIYQGYIYMYTHNRTCNLRYGKNMFIIVVGTIFRWWVCLSLLALKIGCPIQLSSFLESLIWGFLWVNDCFRGQLLKILLKQFSGTNLVTIFDTDPKFEESILLETGSGLTHHGLSDFKMKSRTCLFPNGELSEGNHTQPSNKSNDR